MSTMGLRAAERIGEDMPISAVAVAAELRNAVSLAAVIADDFAHGRTRADRTDALDIRDSVAAVLAIADALGGKRG